MLQWTAVERRLQERMESCALGKAQKPSTQGIGSCDSWILVCITTGLLYFPLVLMWEYFSASLLLSNLK